MNGPTSIGNGLILQDQPRSETTLARTYAAALSLGMLVVSVASGAEIGPKRPNVVFIYTDDQARWAVGAYGNPDVKTPNLDRIARGGRYFRTHSLSRRSALRRASMFTSRYPTDFGIEDWIDPNKEPDIGLAPSAILWPELLRGAGYTAMLAGKWHLGTRDEFHPTRQGYDRFYGFRGGGNQPMNPTLEVEGAVQKLEGSLPDLLVDASLKFVEANRNGPFLLSLHFREPHTPYAPVPEEDGAVFRAADLTVPEMPGLPHDRVIQLTRQYYASVHALDRNVGRLLDALDAWKLTENTVVIFSSDHGYNIGHHGIWHKGNGVWLLDGKTGPRPNMFDHSIRVPLLIRWPGQIKPGTTVDRVVSNLDIFPTVIEMTGIGAPQNLKLAGRSVVPLLKGDGAGSTPEWNDTLFGQYDMHHYSAPGCA